MITLKMVQHSWVWLFFNPPPPTHFVPKFTSVISGSNLTMDDHVCRSFQPNFSSFLCQCSQGIYGLNPSMSNHISNRCSLDSHAWVFKLISFDLDFPFILTVTVSSGL